MTPRRTRLTTALELLPDVVRALAALLAYAALIMTIWTHQPYVAAAAATYLICIGLDLIADAIRGPKPAPRRLNLARPPTSSPTSSPPLPKTPPG